MPWLSTVIPGLQGTLQLSLQFKEYGGEHSCYILAVCPLGCGCCKAFCTDMYSPSQFSKSQPFCGILILQAV